ncbi:nuclear transport factor 2 family protein [Paenibacillus tundrae]
MMKNTTMRMLTASLTALAIMTIAVGCGNNTDPTPAQVEENVSSDESMVSISDSYDNTEELAAKFPIINSTPIETAMEKNIQNRLLNGFENWNRGYEAWEAWGDILYTEDSLYNVHGVKLTLKEYQAAMDAQLKSTDIQMGNFNNMIINDDWAAIRYDISSTARDSQQSSDGSVMEFVHFKDYGDSLGTRVVEGWAGTKGADFDALTHFQTDEAKAAQQAALEEILNTEIPDTTDLKTKYPVTYPTTVDTDMANKIQSAIYSDFDAWNQGFDAWSDWADTYYSSDLKYYTNAETMTLHEYKDAVKNDAAATEVKRIRFDNMLISGDWAAIHYRITNEDTKTGEKTAGDVMQFLHFAEENNRLKVIESWTK